MNSSTNKGRKKLKINKVVVQVCPETSKFYYRRFLSFIIDLESWGTLLQYCIRVVSFYYYYYYYYLLVGIVIQQWLCRFPRESE